MFIDEHREIYGVEPIPGQAGDMPAGFCRSRQRPIASMPHDWLTRPCGLIAPSEMQSCVPRSGASGKRTMRSTACARACPGHDPGSGGS